MRLSIILIPALIGIFGPKWCDAQVNSVLKANQKAIEIVDLAIGTVTGSSRPEEMKTLEVILNGTKAMDGQGFSFDHPDARLPVSQHFIIDFERSFVCNETVDRYLGGYVFSFRTVYTDSSGFSYENPKLRFGKLNILPIANKASLRLQLLRQMPVFLLKGARDNPTSLRYIALENLNGQKVHHLIASIIGMGVTDLYIDDKSHLLLQTAQAVNTAIHGDQLSVIRFKGYHRVSGMLFPGSRTISNTRGLLRDEKIAVRVNSHFDQAVWQQPEHYSMATPEKMEIKSVGQGIWLIENVGGYNVMCLEYQDHLVVLEAVLGSADVIALLNKKFPGKPIRYLAVSHYHEDHSGGVRTFVSHGTTIVAGRQQLRYMQYLIRAPHLMFPDELASTPKTLKFEGVDSIRTFKGGGPLMQMISFGKTAHADELFVYYFPEEKILFQADLLISSDEGKLVRPLIALNYQFYQKLNELQLKVNKIYGVHLKPVDYSDFEVAIKTP